MAVKHIASASLRFCGRTRKCCSHLAHTHTAYNTSAVHSASINVLLPSTVHNCSLIATPPQHHYSITTATRAAASNSSNDNAAVDLFVQQYPSIHGKEKGGEQQSKRTPLLIIHGLMGSSNNWRNIGSKPEISHNRLVYGIDVRNHGNSPHSHVMSYDAMVNDVLKVMEKHNFDKVSIIGHSLGGKIAMATALLFPHHVEQLCIVDMNPSSANPKRDDSWLNISNIVDACSNVDLDKCHTRDDCDQQLQHDVPEKSVRQFLLQNLVWDKGHNKYKWRINLPIVKENMHAIAAFPYNDPSKYRFDGDTLFVAGGRSDYIRDKHKKLIGELFPHSRTEVVEGGGHCVHVEKARSLSKSLVTG